MKLMFSERLRLSGVASVLSIIGHPFLVSVIMVAATTAHRSHGGAVAKNALLVAGFVVVPLLCLIVVQRRRGAWETVDASRVEERPLLFWVGLVSLALLALYEWLQRESSFLLRGTLVVIGLLVCCALITRLLRFKISLHLACAGLAAAVLLRQGQGLGWALLIFLPILAWSRVALGRHLWRETFAGALVGVIAGFFA